MQINIDEKNGVFVFRLAGDMNMDTSPDVKKSFRQALRDKREKIVVDLSSVNYVDSSALATLVEIFKEMRRYGGALKLSGLSPKVLGLLEITKLNKLFDIRRSELEAVDSF